MAAEASNNLPSTSTDCWTRNSVVILIISTACFAFDWYEGNAFNLSTPAIMQQFHIDRTTIAIIPLVTRWIGLVGSLGLVPLADIYGRRVLVSALVLGYSILSGLTGFVQSWPQLFITKSLTQIPLGMSSVSAIMVSEGAPTRWRGFAQGVYVSGYPIGAAIASVVFRRQQPVLSGAVPDRGSRVRRRDRGRLWLRHLILGAARRGRAGARGWCLTGPDRIAGIVETWGQRFCFSSGPKFD